MSLLETSSPSKVTVPTTVVVVLVNPYPAGTFATRIEQGQTAHECSLTRLYIVGWPTSSCHLNIPKMIVDSAKNGKCIIPLKKFSRLRVKLTDSIYCKWMGNVKYEYAFLTWYEKKTKTYLREVPF